jgi:hypothetical protein
LSAAPSRTRLSDVLHRRACALAQPAVVGTLKSPYFAYKSRLGYRIYPCHLLRIL